MLRPKLFVPLYNGARAALVAGSHGAQTGVPPYGAPQEPDLGSALPGSQKAHAHQRDAGSAQPDGHYQGPASDYSAASAAFPDASGVEAGYPGLDGQGAAHGAQWQQQSGAAPASQQPWADEDQQRPRGASGASFPVPQSGPAEADAAPPHLAFATPLRAILQPALPAAGSGTPPTHLVARSLYPPHVFPLPFQSPSLASNHSLPPLEATLPGRASSASPGVLSTPPCGVPAVPSHASLGHAEGVSPWRPSQAVRGSTSAAPATLRDDLQQSLNTHGASFAGQREPGAHPGAARQPVSGAEHIAPDRSASGDATATEQVIGSFRSHLHERAAPVAAHSWQVPPPLAPLPIPSASPQHGVWLISPGAAGQAEAFHRHLGPGAPGEGPWRASPLLASSLGGAASLPQPAAAGAAAGVRAYHHAPASVSRPPMPGAPMVHRAREVLPLGQQLPPRVSKGSLREELGRLTRGQGIPGAPEAHRVVVSRPLSPLLGRTPSLPDLPDLSLTLQAAASRLIPDVLAPAQDVGALPRTHFPGALELEAEACEAPAVEVWGGRQGAPAESVPSQARDISAEAAPAESSVSESAVKPHKPRHRGRRGGRNKHTAHREPRPMPASSEQASSLVLPLSASPGGTPACGTLASDSAGAHLGLQKKGFHGQARRGADEPERGRARVTHVRVSSMRVCQVLDSCLQRLHTSAARADPSLAPLSPEACAALLQEEWERAWGPRYATSSPAATAEALLKLPQLSLEGHAAGGPGAAAVAGPGLSQRGGARRESSWKVPVLAWHITEALKGVRTLAVAQGLMQWSEQHQGVRGDAHLYSAYIARLAKCGNLEAVEAVHEMVRRREIPTSSWTYNRLINGYRGLNRNDLALAAYEEVKASGALLDCAIFSSVMSLHNRAGRYTKVVETFEEMVACRVRPDDIAYSLLVAAYGRLGDKFSARRVQQELCQQGVQPSLGVMNALMHAHCKAGDYKESRRIFQQMREEGPAPDQMSFTIAIDVASKEGLPWEAEALFEELESLNLPTDAIAWGSMLQMFGRFGDLRRVKLWFRRMLRSGCQPTVATFNSLLFPLVKMGLFEEAELLLDWMLRQGHTPSLMTYSLFLSRCTHAGSCEEAHTMLRLMANTRSEGHEVISLLLTPPGAPLPSADAPTLPATLPLRFQATGPDSQDPSAPVAQRGGAVWDSGVSLSSLAGREGASGRAGLSRGSSSSRSGGSSQEVGSGERGLSVDSASEAGKGPPGEGGYVWEGGELSEEAKWARIEEILDSGMMVPGKRWADMVEERRCFADASLDFLAKFGLHGSGARLWDLFLERDLYDGAAKVLPQDWKGGTCEVNFHVMSRNTAQLVLKWALRELRRTHETQGVCPDHLLLITGWGKRSREPGVPLVKQAIEQSLLAYRVPFNEGIGAFSVNREELEDWFDNPAYAGLPDLHDDWTS